MRQTNVTAMVEAGVMSAIAIIFALISAYVPLLGSIVNLIWPVPIILLGVRHGHKWSILATVVAGITIAVLTDPIRSLKIIIGFGFVGIAMGYAFRANFSPAKTLFWGSVVSTVSSVALIGLTMLLLGINPLNLEFEMMEKAFNQVLEIYRSNGIGEEQLAQMREISKYAMTLMKVILPTIIGLGAILATYINFVVARLVLKRLGQPVAGFPPFKSWAFPQYVLYAFILGTVLLYLGKNQEIELVSNAGENLRWLGIILAFIQGLAVFYFFADKYSLSRLMRSIILLLIFTNALFELTVVFIGAFDIALDYRRMRTPRSS